MIKDKQEFLEHVVLPIKSYNVNSSVPWALRDTQSNFLLVSDSLASNFGFKDAKYLVGRNLKELPFLDEDSERALFSFDKEVIETKKIIKKVTLFKRDANVLVRVITMIPILFNGEVIAIDIPGSFVNQYHFDLELFNKINRIPICGKLNQTKIEEEFTQQELRVLNLLILGKTQQDIADLLQISRTRVVQLIANSCDRLDINSASSKVLVDKAIALNHHRNIPPEFFYI